MLVFVLAGKFVFWFCLNLQNMIVIGLDHLDSISRLGTTSNVEIAPKTAAAILAATPSVRSEPPEAPNRVDPNPPPESVDPSSAKLIGHELIKPEQTGILPEQLQQNYKFARVCASCFIQRRVQSSHS